MQAITAEHGGGAFDWATRPEDRTRLWKARHAAYYAAMALRAGKQGFATDACVPISRLADCIMETKADVAATGLVAPIVGHVGDGNFHLVRAVRPARPGRAREGRERSPSRVSLRAIAMGGTCTGEHGIGVHKLDALRGRARRGGRRDARDQARARSAQHHEPGQDGARVARVERSEPIQTRSPDAIHLYLGNKNYSSWSLRGWLAMRLAGAPFKEAMVRAPARRNPIRRTGRSRRRRACPACTTATSWSGIRSRSPSTWPSGMPGMWPADPRGARLGALASPAEMHSGFCGAAQRDDDVHPRAGRRAAVVGRRSPPTSIASPRSGTRAAPRFGGGGPFLCGAFSLADAFYAPVAFRFRTYGVAPRRAAGAYLAALLAHPCSREWEARRAGRDGDRRGRRAARPLPRQARGRGRHDERRDRRRLAGSGSARPRRRRRPLRHPRRRHQGFLRRRRASGDVLDTRAYAGIVDYDPTELVMTARAGTPLADIERALARRRADARRSSRRISARGATLGGASPRASPGRGGPTPARCATSCSACASSTGGATTSRSAAG